VVDKLLERKMTVSPEFLAAMNDEGAEHRKYFGILCAAYPALEADWKGPIEAKFAGEALAIKMARAVEFMTGAPATVTRLEGTEFADTYLLTCVGYRAGPCGDH
jgi:hypothetical protein